MKRKQYFCEVIIKTNNDMKAIPTQQQILDRLISKGNNENDARKLINKNYDYAVEHYRTMKTICECIITID